MNEQQETGLSKEEKDKIITNPLEKVFEHEGKKFIYEFNSLTIEQSELAREVVEFKLNQLDAIKDNFSAILKSGGADWLPKIMSFILIEVRDSDKVKFDRDKAFSNEQWIKELPIKFRKDFEECYVDFFTNMNLEEKALIVLSREKKMTGKEILQSLLRTNS